MMSPELLIKRWLPEIDERAWIVVIAIGGLAVFAIKEISCSSPFLIAILSVGLATFVVRGELTASLLFYGFVGYLPFSRLVAGAGGGPQAGFVNLTTVFVILLIVSLARRASDASTQRLTWTPLHLAIASLAILSVMSWLGTAWTYGGWFAAKQWHPLIHWLLPMGFAFLSFAIVQDRRTLKTVLSVMLVAVTVVALMAIREYLDREGSSFDQSRARGIADHPNVLAAFFVYYMFLFLGIFLAVPRTRRTWMLLVPLLLCARGVMVTFSRGAYLAVAAGVLATCWFRHKGLFLVGILLIAAALLHPALLPEGIRYRMNMTLSTQGGEFSSKGDVTEHLETSAGARVAIWRAALQMIHEHPFWGIGFGAFTGFLPHYTQGKLSDLDAHNSFLMIAAEMGLLTLAVFVVVLMLLGRYAVQLFHCAHDAILRGMALGLLAGLAGLIVANLFTVCIFAQEVIGYFWVLCGLVARALLLERHTASGANA